MDTIIQYLRWDGIPFHIVSWDFSPPFPPLSPLPSPFPMVLSWTIGRPSNNSIDQWWTVLDQILGKKSSDLFSNPFHSISYWLIDTDLRSVTNSLWCDCYEPSRVVGIVMTVPSRDAIAPFCDVIVMNLLWTSSTCHDCHCYGTAAALFWPTIDTEKHPNMVAAITIVAIDAIIGIVLLLLCQQPFWIDQLQLHRWAASQSQMLVLRKTFLYFTLQRNAQSFLTSDIALLNRRKWCLLDLHRNRLKSTLRGYRCGLRIPVADISGRYGHSSY